MCERTLPSVLVFFTIKLSLFAKLLLLYEILILMNDCLLRYELNLLIFMQFRLNYSKNLSFLICLLRTGSYINLERDASIFKSFCVLQKTIKTWTYLKLTQIFTWFCVNKLKFYRVVLKTFSKISKVHLYLLRHRCFLLFNCFFVCFLVPF